MQHNLVYALIAIVAISVGTIGFANTLTVSAINPIGGNDGAVASPTLGTITSVTWTEIGTADGDVEIDTATVTVDNADASAHTYELCAILSDGVSQTSGLGCQATGSIGAGANLAVVVDFSPDFDTILATQVYFTLEELS
jgi:hypothetical protein